MQRYFERSPVRRKGFALSSLFVLMCLAVSQSSALEPSQSSVVAKCKEISKLNKAKHSREAERLADSLLRQYPQENRYRHEKIEILHDRLNYDAALKEIDVCLASNPRDFVAYYWQADILSHQEDFQAARIAVNKCIESNPRYAPGYELKSTFEYRERKHRHALSYASLALKYDAKDAGAWNSRGLAYLGLGDVQAAIRDFRKAVELSPGATLYLNNLAEALRDSGRVSEALEKLNQALKLEPDNYYILQKRARAYGDMGSIKLALNDINRVIAARPDKVADDYVCRAYIYIRQARYADAVVDAKHALKVNPQFASAYYVIGVALYCQHKYKDAIPYFTKVLELDQYIGLAHKVRGLCYKAIGEDEKALADLEQYTSLFHDEESYRARAAIAAKQGYFEQAADDLAALTPFAGGLKTGKKDYNRLISLYSRMAKAGLGGKEVYFDRGMVYFVAGDTELACRDFEQYLRQSGAKGRNALPAAVWAMLGYRKMKKEPQVVAVLNYLKGANPGLLSSGELLYLKNEISAERFFSTVQEKRALTFKGTIIGLNLSYAGRKEEALHYLRKVEREGDKHMDEYFLALGEIQRLK